MKAAAGILGGSAVGLALALADTLLGSLAGQAESSLWLQRLALVYVPPLAILGVGSSVLEPARPHRPSLAPLLTLHALLFGHTAAVFLQQQLPGASLSSPQRLESLTLVAGLVVMSLLWLGRLDHPLNWLEAAVFSFAVPIASLSATTSFASPPATGFAIIAFPCLGIPLSIRCATLARAGRPMRVLAATAVAALATAAAFLLADPAERLGADSRFRKSEKQPLRSSTEPTRRPNIVLIVLDTLRAENLSCYGYSRPISPNIDAFAREAVLYSNFAATACWTLPTHASLFTGLYASRHGADRPSPPDWRPDRNAHPLDNRFQTLAETLSSAGYATAGFASNFTLDRSTGLDQGFREYDASPAVVYTSLLARAAARLPSWGPWLPIHEWLATPFRSAGSIARDADDWLRSHPAEQPYFLFLNFMDAHAPYAPRRDLHGWRPPGGGTGQTAWGLSEESASAILSGRRSITASESSELTARYDAAVAYLDQELGKLLDSLRRRTDYPDTWVILLADHGEALGEHQTLGHGLSLFQEVLHCPLLIKYPRSLAFEAGTRDNRPVQTVDIMPTIIDGVGLPLPDDVAGTPLRRGRELMFAEAAIPPLANQFSRFHRELRAVIHGRYKYIESSAGDAELYDLGDDPREERDLAAMMPRKAAQLKERLEAWRLRMTAGEPRRSRTPAPLTDAQRDRLRALGYVR